MNIFSKNRFLLVLTSCLIVTTAHSRADQTLTDQNSKNNSKINKYSLDSFKQAWRELTFEDKCIQVAKVAAAGAVVYAVGVYYTIVPTPSQIGMYLKNSLVLLIPCALLAHQDQQSDEKDNDNDNKQSTTPPSIAIDNTLQQKDVVIIDKHDTVAAIQPQQIQETNPVQETNKEHDIPLQETVTTTINVQDQEKIMEVTEETIAPAAAPIASVHQDSHSSSNNAQTPQESSQVQTNKEYVIPSQENATIEQKTTVAAPLADNNKNIPNDKKQKGLQEIVTNYLEKLELLSNTQDSSKQQHTNNTNEQDRKDTDSLLLF